MTAAAIAGRARTVVARGLDAALLTGGLAVHAVTGWTPSAAYLAMRRLYGPTAGLFNRAHLRLARLLRPARPVAAVDGFLGHWDAPRIARLVAALDADGIAVLDERLPPEMCDALEALARRTPATPLGEATTEVYAEARARALRYDFAEQDLLRDPTACRIVFDGTFAAIAEAYFRCRPLFDFCTMWWTTRFGPRDLSKAAQQFHFDLDRLTFLKFFIYLTDVGEDNGPHVFVAGSHRSKPAALAAPRRFSDEEVHAAFPDSVRVQCGPRGTIFAADTSGLHKGQPVVDGHRLVFQVEFTVSDFGQRYPRAVASAEAIAAAGLRAPVDRRVYRRVLPAPGGRA